MWRSKIIYTGANSICNAQTSTSQVILDGRICVSCSGLSQLPLGVLRFNHDSVRNLSSDLL